MASLRWPTSTDFIATTENNRGTTRRKKDDERDVIGSGVVAIIV